MVVAIAGLVDVDVGRLDRAEPAELDDVVAAVDLFVEPAVAGADDVPRVARQQIREPDARLHGRARSCGRSRAACRGA